MCNELALTGRLQREWNPEPLGQQASASPIELPGLPDLETNTPFDILMKSLPFASIISAQLSF